MNIKTEKRPAEVDEWILITDRYVDEEKYENGEWFRVGRTEPVRGMVFTKGGIMIFDEEYEVIVEEDEASGGA